MPPAPGGGRESHIFSQSETGLERLDAGGEVGSVNDAAATGRGWFSAPSFRGRMKSFWSAFDFGDWGINLPFQLKSRHDSQSRLQHEWSINRKSHVRQRD